MRAKTIGSLLLLLSLPLAAVLLASSCSRKPAEAGGRALPAQAGLAELGGRPMRILVVPLGLPSGPVDLDKGGTEALWLEAMARRVAEAMGTGAEIRVAHPGDASPDTAFHGADVVVAPLQGGGLDGWRRTARLVPFWPMPGSPSRGPGVAWWAVARDKPILAAAMAAALSAALRDGGLAAELDKVLGDGMAWRYFSSVGYDGILRAQYLELSEAEEAWVRSRLSGGTGLRAAVREGNSFAYVPQPDGSVRGFDHDLLVALANSLGLGFELTVVKDIGGFFTKDGVVPSDLGEADYDYTPDLLKRVDLYANPFGVTPWRQRMMRMLTIYPIRNQLAGRRGEEVTAIGGLDRKRFAVIQDSVQQKTLEDFAGKRGLRFSFVYGANEDGLFDLVRKGKADYILDGSVVFALNVDKLSDFGLSPFFSELQGVAWAVRKDDEVFAGIVSRFLDASRTSGLLPALWQKTFRMDYESYVSAMMATGESGE